MELPAIVVSLFLYRRMQPRTTLQPGMAKLWHEAFTNRSVVLLLGGVVIGMIHAPDQGSAVTDLYTGAFKAVLALFQLEMGMVAAGTLRPFPWRHWRLLLFAVSAPPITGNDQDYHREPVGTHPGFGNHTRKPDGQRILYCCTGCD
jgi:hypothetical protein